MHVFSDDTPVKKATLKAKFPPNTSVPWLLLEGNLPHLDAWQVNVEAKPQYDDTTHKIRAAINMTPEELDSLWLEAKDY